MLRMCICCFAICINVEIGSGHPGSYFVWVRPALKIIRPGLDHVRSKLLSWMVQKCISAS